jgi:hypothetical protein
MIDSRRGSGWMTSTHADLSIIEIDKQEKVSACACVCDGSSSLSSYIAHAGNTVSNKNMKNDVKSSQEE